MSTTIKAYIVIMAIGIACYFIWQSATKKLLVVGDDAGINRHVNKAYFTSWAIITSIVFLSFNYYLFAILAMFAIYRGLKNMSTSHRGGFYIFLLLGVSSVNFTLPGFFGINKLFNISWATLLGFAFLIFMQNNSPSGNKKKNIIDVFVLWFWLLVSALSFRETTTTDGLRETFIYLNLIVVPYFIARKFVREPEELQWVFYGFVFIVLIISGIGIFESIKNWLLYGSLGGALNLPESAITSYKYRAGFLRVSSTLGNINLAGVCGGALIVYYYLISNSKKSNSQWLIFLVVLYALFATHSRAPWLVSTAMILFYVAKTKGAKGVIRLSGYGFLLGLLLLASGALDSVVSGFMLKDSYNVDYRERLLTLGLNEMKKYPLFGNLHFYSAPGLQELIQGEGIIDIVNTFLQIGLKFGLIAVGFFTWLVVLWPLYLYKNNSDSIKAVVYFVTMGGLVAVLFTVSSFSPGNMFPLLMFLTGAGHALRKN